MTDAVAMVKKVVSVMDTRYAVGTNILKKCNKKSSVGGGTRWEGGKFEMTVN
jgi:hypothetical protein